MKKAFYLFIILLDLATYAQSNETIAILDFENKAELKDITMQRVAGKIRQEFSSRVAYVLLDRWLIDTMISAQGTKQLLKCIDESCLFAIGHLLSVNLVLSGSITKLDRQYCISADLVDISNNIASGYTESFLLDFKDTTIAAVMHKLVNKLLELRNEKKVAISNLTNNQYLKQKQNNLNSNTIDSGQGKPLNKTSDKIIKKTSLTNKIIWVPVAAVVLGGAAAGIYFYKNKHTSGNATNNDISLDDEPKHPGTALKP